MGGVEDSLSELRLADHMIYVTLPLLNDKRIFINAVDHLGNAIGLAIREFMKKEKDYKRLSYLPEDELLIDEFIKKYCTNTKLAKYAGMIKDITAFNKVRSNSSIKLKRNDKFIVISPEYTMTALSIEQVKNYLKMAKEFVEKMRSLI